MPATTNTYDEFASQYADMMSAQEQAGVAPDSAMARFLQVVGDVSGLTVLDAGCGEGYLSRILAQRGAHVTGIDISSRLIEMARAKDPDGAITYEVADLSQPLPAYQAHFDLVASYFVLNDVYDYQGFLTTLSASLKPAWSPRDLHEQPVFPGGAQPCHRLLRRLRPDVPVSRHDGGGGRGPFLAPDAGRIPVRLFRGGVPIATIGGCADPRGQLQAPQRHLDPGGLPLPLLHDPQPRQSVARSLEED